MMTTQEAHETLEKGGQWPLLAEAIGVVAGDPMTSLKVLMLGLAHGGVVAEQAALALYRRTFRPIPENRQALVTNPSGWQPWLKTWSASKAPK